MTSDDRSRGRMLRRDVEQPRPRKSTDGRAIGIGVSEGHAMIAADIAADVKRKPNDVRHRHKVSNLLPHVPDRMPRPLCRQRTREPRRARAVASRDRLSNTAIRPAMGCFHPHLVGDFEGERSAPKRHFATACRYEQPRSDQISITRSMSG